MYNMNSYPHPNFEREGTYRVRRTSFTLFSLCTFINVGDDLCDESENSIESGTILQVNGSFCLLKNEQSYYYVVIISIIKYIWME